MHHFGGLLQKSFTLLLLHVSIRSHRLLKFINLLTHLYLSITYSFEQSPSIQALHGWGCLCSHCGWATWWANGFSYSLCFIGARFVSLPFNQLHIIQQFGGPWYSWGLFTQQNCKSLNFFGNQARVNFLWAETSVQLGWKKNLSLEPILR